MVNICVCVCAFRNTVLKGPPGTTPGLQHHLLTNPSLNWCKQNVTICQNGAFLAYTVMYLWSRPQVRSGEEALPHPTWWGGFGPQSTPFPRAPSTTHHPSLHRFRVKALKNFLFVVVVVQKMPASPSCSWWQPVPWAAQ